MGIVSSVLNLIPHYGELVATIFSTILTIGIFNIAAKIYQQNQEGSFLDMFLFITDKEVRDSLIPLLILRVILDLPIVISSFYLPEDSIIRIMILLVFSILLVFFISFSIPLMLFQKVNLLDSIKLTLKGVSQNIMVLFLSSIVVVIVAGLSVLLLVLPAIFVFLPLMLFYQYFIYITIFEGINLE
jgi:hypothetical protein